MKALRIGLMGLTNDGILVTPSGTQLFSVGQWLGSKVQRIQHWIAQKTWKR
jgi:hypothetical protein